MAQTADEERAELGPLLHGKVVLVTGARRGIGAAIAEAAARAGARVALFATARSDETARRIREATGAEALVLEGDVASAADVEAMVERTAEAFGGLDVLVNNAAVLGAGGLFETSEQQLRRTLDVNVVGVFLASRAAARRMVEQGRGGAIVNLGSDLAVRGAAGLAVYAATKGAVLQLTRSLAVELGPHGIRVAMLAPGATETDMTAEALADPATRRLLCEKGVLGRVNRPEEVAAAAVFLASAAAGTVTGCSWPVDCGALAT